MIDLHGHSQESARALLLRRLPAAASAGARVALVITGKGVRAEEDRHPLERPRRGVLRERLPVWLNEAELRQLVAALRPAHPRHGGGGSWYVVLRRQRGG